MSTCINLSRLDADFASGAGDSPAQRTTTLDSVMTQTWQGMRKCIGTRQACEKIFVTADFQYCTNKNVFVLISMVVPGRMAKHSIGC